MKHLASYLFIRVVTFPISFLPYKTIHSLGKILGKIAFFIMPRFRKKAFSNIALAKVAITEEELHIIAKESFQNLMITCLEYVKLAREKNISRIATCLNPEEAISILDQGKGVIFFCGHQANWEILFLEGTSRMPGVAIGRPIKNQKLYEWILSIRERFGGKIITPKNAIKEGLRALKQGAFLGIVGDQGMPDSGFSSPFFGLNAWTSPIPALLAYRTGTPIIVATTVRKGGKYWIHYSSPIWPNLVMPAADEIDRMMRASLQVLEKSIAEHPGQWLWQHNRWKQQTPEKIKRRFRQDSICVLLPKNSEQVHNLLPHLPILRQLYPHEFLTFLVPNNFSKMFNIENVDVHFYEKEEELLLEDFRFKLIFNFADHEKAKSHYSALSAFEVVTLTELQKLAGNTTNFSEVFIKALSHAR